MTTYVGMRDQNDGHPYPKPWATMPYIVGHKYPKAWANLGIKHILTFPVWFNDFTTTDIKTEKIDAKDSKRLK